MRLVPIASAAFILTVLAIGITAREWILVAGAAVSAILLVPIIVARLRADGRWEREPDLVTNALYFLSRAQRTLVVMVAFAAVIAFAVASRGWSIMVVGGPGLVAMALWLGAVVRREGWSGNKTGRD